MRTTACLFLALGTVLAQEPNPVRQNTVASTGPMPIFRVTVVSRTTKAINYHHRTGTTKIDFHGTTLMPALKGEADVKSEMGSTKIDSSLEKMTPASQFGPEYMTYVMWAVTPEGRANNIGEIVIEGGRSKLMATSSLQSFGLIVTAEPYFAVTQPSDVVVAENFVRNDTTGTIEQVDAKFELLERGNYVMDRGRYRPVKIDPKGPLQLAEAENAVELARLAGAEKYAADTFEKAVVGLGNAQGFLRKGGDRKRSETNAREAAQMAEDARIITLRKMRAEELASERAASEQRELASKASAEESAMRSRRDSEARLQAENERRAADAARAQAEQAKLDAQSASARAEQDKAAAEAARQEALHQQDLAKADVEKLRGESDRLRMQAQQAEADKAQLRERLRLQFAAILETRESARGLIVNISDVLFDFNKYTLKEGAREKLAKVSGILLAYPGLKIKLEGHTDSIGTDEYNLKLSDQRANAVLEYLVSQGVKGESLSSQGLGKGSPVASNDTDAGRQQNRRVEMIVSGDPIGITQQQ